MNKSKEKRSKDFLIKKYGRIKKDNNDFMIPIPISLDEQERGEAIWKELYE